MLSARALLPLQAEIIPSELPHAALLCLERALDPRAASPPPPPPPRAASPPAAHEAAQGGGATAAAAPGGGKERGRRVVRVGKLAAMALWTLAEVPATRKALPLARCVRLALRLAQRLAKQKKTAAEALAPVGALAAILSEPEAHVLHTSA